MQAPKRPDVLKNHGGNISEFNQHQIEKKIQRDINGGMGIEITNDNG